MYIAQAFAVDVAAPVENLSHAWQAESMGIYLYSIHSSENHSLLDAKFRLRDMS
jgi:hypothetical protein